MKQLLLVLALLVSMVGSSQTIHYYDSTGVEYDHDPRTATYDSLGNVTYYTDDTIKLPYSVARKVAKELVGCDSAKAILELTKEQLSLTETKVVIKDSIITNHIKKEDIYKQVITNQDQKFELQGQWVSELRSQNKKLKAKLTFMQAATTVFVAVLTYIYVRK